MRGPGLFRRAYIRLLVTLASILQWEYRVLQYQQTRNLEQRARVLDYLADATRIPRTFRTPVDYRAEALHFENFAENCRLTREQLDRWKPRPPSSP